MNKDADGSGLAKSIANSASADCRFAFGSGVIAIEQRGRWRRAAKFITFAALSRPLIKGGFFAS
jgi:hypothetical protein